MLPWRTLRSFLARPRMLYIEELSPHLLKDIGLWDEPSRRS
jgi:hypothetical protein